MYRPQSIYISSRAKNLLLKFFNFCIGHNPFIFLPEHRGKKTTFKIISFLYWPQPNYISTRAKNYMCTFINNMSIQSPVKLFSFCTGPLLFPTGTNGWNTYGFTYINGKRMSTLNYYKCHLYRRKESSRTHRTSVLDQSTLQSRNKLSDGIL